ncbi:MAG: rhomboid family intramembrane serine protease [Bacteroidetes bacterium]|nr:rhomboid family intramembrane serine protease [Bacteroidota bacterium]
MFRLTPVVKNLLIINGLFFLAQQAFPSFMITHFSLFHFYSPLFEPHQVITHMFMHGDFMHLFGNMFALFMFGPLLEGNWGSKRFLIFYTATGLGAVALHLGVKHIELINVASSLSSEQFNEVLTYGLTSINQGIPFSLAAQDSLNAIINTPTLGASGAVFGILLGFGMMFPNMMIMIYFLFPMKAKHLVILYGAFELYAGLANHAGDNVAHFAHLGGMLFGWLLIKKWGLRRIH